MIVVLLVLACYAGGLFAALAMRRAVLVRVSPDRATLYRVGADGRVYNQFRYTLANRGGKPAAVTFSIAATAGRNARAGDQSGDGETRGEPGRANSRSPRRRRPRREIVSHFTIVTSTVPEQDTETIPMTFLAPGEKQ